MCSSPAGATDAAAAAVVALAPHPLVFADTTTAAFFALAPPPVRSHVRSIITCSQRSIGQGSCGASWRQKDVVPELWPGPINCLVHTALFVPVALSLWPSRYVPLQHSLLACRQPPGHQRDPTSSVARPPYKDFRCSRCGASLSRVPLCLRSFSLDLKRDN